MASSVSCLIVLILCISRIRAFSIEASGPDDSGNTFATRPEQQEEAPAEKRRQLPGYVAYDEDAVYAPKSTRTNETLKGAVLAHLRYHRPDFPSVLPTEKSDQADFPVCVDWIGNVFALSGYGDEARQFIFALDEAGISVRAVVSLVVHHGDESMFSTGQRDGVHSMASRAVLSAERVASSLARLDTATASRLALLLRKQHPTSCRMRVAVHHMVPNEVERLSQYDFHIVRTMFETDRIRKSWVAYLQDADEVWVPSLFNVDTFARSGVPRDSIAVIPEPMDTYAFQSSSRPSLISRERQIVFLSVLHWTERKGWDTLIAAFMKAFPSGAFRGQRVLLRIKASTFGKATKNEMIAFLRERVRERLLVFDIPEFIDIQVEDVESPVALYKDADAFVLFSRGEGWCRPCAEALALRLPVIATKCCGQLAFLREDNSYLIPCTTQPVNAEAARQLKLSGDHKWCAVRIDDAAEALRTAAAELLTGKAAERAKRGEEHVRRELSRRSVGEIVRHRLAALWRAFRRGTSRAHRQ